MELSKKLKIKDESGINLDVDDLLTEKLQNITIGDTSQREILENSFFSFSSVCIEVTAFRKSMARKPL